MALDEINLNRTWEVLLIITGADEDFPLPHTRVILAVIQRGVRALVLQAVHFPRGLYWSGFRDLEDYFHF